ncbi:hypothetical protein E2C01_077102 [Portunus trituberculatus]|uniref:Uncharacterized protein n=1 Tax=Portunus trituberculatus TaxID=210409 RepID=A0A5B7IQF3_PORTR|nr:hypothetical protein [Portunus trituberculatus]
MCLVAVWWVVVELGVSSAPKPLHQRVVGLFQLVCTYALLISQLSLPPQFVCHA